MKISAWRAQILTLGSEGFTHCFVLFYVINLPNIELIYEYDFWTQLVSPLRVYLLSNK